MRVFLLLFLLCSLSNCSNHLMNMLMANDSYLTFGVSFVHADGIPSLMCDSLDSILDHTMRCNDMIKNGVKREMKLDALGVSNGWNEIQTRNDKNNQKKDDHDSMGEYHMFSVDGSEKQTVLLSEMSEGREGMEDVKMPRNTKKSAGTEAIVANVFAQNSLMQRAHYLLVALPIRGHLVPLQRIALELASRGARITWASLDEDREWAAAIVGIKFVELNANPGNIGNTFHIKEKIRISQMINDPSFLKSLLNIYYEIYLPYAGEMFAPLLEAMKKYVLASDVW